HVDMVEGSPLHRTGNLATLAGASRRLPWRVRSDVLDTGQPDGVAMVRAPAAPAHTYVGRGRLSTIFIVGRGAGRVRCHPLHLDRAGALGEVGSRLGQHAL